MADCLDQHDLLSEVPPPRVVYLDAIIDYMPRRITGIIKSGGEITKD